MIMNYYYYYFSLLVFSRLYCTQYDSLLMSSSCLSDSAVCMSVRLSLTLCIVVKRCNLYSKSVWTSV